MGLKVTILFVICFFLAPTVIHAWNDRNSLFDCSKIRVVDPKKSKKSKNDFLVAVEEVSRALLGKRYSTDPLGEGSDGKYDKDPLFRMDAFDCTTYIESAWALAKCIEKKNSSEYPVCLANHMRMIRYQNGVISYETRNHFPEVDWIPNNSSMGFVEDISEKITRNKHKKLKATIDKKNWYAQKKVPDLNSFGENILPQAVTISYVPLTFLLEVVPSPLNTSNETKLKKDVVEKFPDIALFNEVKEGWLPAGVGTPMLISHQGFIIKKDGDLYMRHASLKEKKVIEEKLTDYMKKYMKGSQVRGFSILQINP